MRAGLSHRPIARVHAMASSPTRVPCSICSRTLHPAAMKCGCCGVVLHGEWETPQVRGARLICKDCGPRLGLPDIRPQPHAETCVALVSEVVRHIGRRFRRVAN